MSTLSNTHTSEKSHACYRCQLVPRSSVFIVCVADSYVSLVVHFLLLLVAFWLEFYLFSGWSFSCYYTIIVREVFSSSLQLPCIACILQSFLTLICLTLVPVHIFILKLMLVFFCPLASPILSFSRVASLTTHQII